MSLISLKVQMERLFICMVILMLTYYHNYVCLIMYYDLCMINNVINQINVCNCCNNICMINEIKFVILCFCATYLLLIILYLFYEKTNRAKRMTNVEGDEYFVDSVTTYTIVRDKRYFLNLLSIKANVFTIFGST